MSGFRLDPQDEFSHPPGPEPTFNESFYANGFDPGTGVGGWMRIGNRPNEGHAEVSLCLYLPDGRIACWFDRPKIAGSDRFAAGGLALAVEEPFRRATARFDGEVLLLDDPAMLRDPKTMYASAPRVRASLDWRLDTVSPVHGGEPLRDDVPTMYGRDFSLGHFNQHTRVEGPLVVGDQRWELRGFGWRDHSWGPRTWQAIHHYRLFIGNFGADAGFMLLKITDHEGRVRRVGTWFADGRYEEVEDLDLVVDWDANREPASVRISVRTAHRRTVLTGHVRTLAPLRNRRELGGKLVTSRIAEGLTEFRWEGRTGLGMSEFIEVLEDGVPAGWPL